MTPAKKLIDDGKRELLNKSAFDASIVFSVELFEDSSVPTGYTDGTKIGYNPDFITTLSIGQVATFLAHEARHISLLHFARMAGKSIEDWNKATDFAINQTLVDEGFQPLKGWLFDQKYKGQSSEQIYNAIHQKDDAGKKDKNKDQKPGQGQPDPNAKNQPGKPQQGQGQPDFRDEVRQPSGDPAKVEEIKKDVASKIISARAAEKRMGKGSGFGEKSAGNAVARNVDWKSELQELLVNNLPSDFSYRKPDVRFSDSEFLIPDLDEPTPDDFAIAFDVSGSVSEKDAALYLSSVGQMLGSLSVEQNQIDVVQFDTAIVSVGKFNSKIKFVAGGGTDYKWIDGFVRNKNYAGLIIFTDGYCDSFPKKPDFPVFWVITTSSAFRPPFGNVIYIYPPGNFN